MNLVTAPIKLDVERNLGYNFRAIRAIKKEQGEDPALNTSFWENMNGERLLVVVWAGLLHESPDLTLDQVSDWMVPSEITNYLEAVTKAWNANNVAAEAPADPQMPTAV